MRSLLKPIFAATTSVSDLVNPRLWLLNAFGAKTASGVTVGPDTAMTLAVHYACLRNASEDVGKLPFKVYKQLKPRGKEPLPTHPVYRLVHTQPNDIMSAMTFREMLTHWAMGWGNGYAEIVRDDRRLPTELWPIHPSRVVVKRDQSTDGNMVYDVHGSDGVTVHFQQHSIFHLRGLGDELKGYSVVKLGAEALGRALAVQEYSSKFFANGTTAGGVYTTPEALDPKARDRLRETWPKGLPDAHNPLFLEGGLKWEPMSINPEDAQMIETAKFSVIDICRFHRMPPHKVQSLENQTYTNIEFQGIDYVVDTLLSWLKRWELEVLRKLLVGEDDLFAEHVIAGLLRGDSKARGEFATKLWNIGAISQNDIREWENLNPIEGGDKHYVERNRMAIEDAEQNITEEPESAPTPQRPSRFESFKRMTMGTFVDAAGRLIRKEQNAVTRAHKRCGNDHDAFDAWADKFYSEHTDQVFDVLWPNVELLAELVIVDLNDEEYDDDVRDRLDGMLRVYATQHCSDARTSIAAAFTQSRVAENCEAWETALPPRMASDLTDQTVATVRACVYEGIE